MENPYLFLKTESDFYQYLTLYGGINKHSRTNYMSWLKFLSLSYSIDNSISDEYIDSIIERERGLLHAREKYTTERDLVNFRSALRKYKAFVHSDFLKMQEETVLSEIAKVEQDTSITSTERIAIVKSRIGQGDFREKLIAFWKGCSVSGCQMTDILVASHIKPWRVASNQERLDTFMVCYYCRITTNYLTKVIYHLIQKGELFSQTFFQNQIDYCCKLEKTLI